MIVMMVMIAMVVTIDCGGVGDGDDHSDVDPTAVRNPYIRPPPPRATQPTSKGAASPIPPTTKPKQPKSPNDLVSQGPKHRARKHDNIHPTLQSYDRCTATTARNDVHFFAAAPSDGAGLLQPDGRRARAGAQSARKQMALRCCGSPRRPARSVVQAIDADAVYIIVDSEIIGPTSLQALRAMPPLCPHALPVLLSPLLLLEPPALVPLVLLRAVARPRPRTSPLLVFAFFFLRKVISPLELCFTRALCGASRSARSLRRSRVTIISILRRASRSEYNGRALCAISPLLRRTQRCCLLLFRFPSPAPFFRLGARATAPTLVFDVHAQVVKPFT